MKKLIDEFVRDVCSVQPNVKSEVRRRLKDLIALSKEETIDSVIKTIYKIYT